MNTMLHTTTAREKDLEEICDLVQRATGIQLPPQKHGMVTARLQKRLRALGLASFREYVALVRSGRAEGEMTELIDLLTTNKTSFYREPRHFDILTERLQAAAKKGGAPRVWSAGCSSGEEPYTIATCALLASATDTRVLATDLSTRVLALAKAGTYAKGALDDVPPAARSELFLRRGDELSVAPDVRRMVSFAALNLLGPWPMRGPFDAIFCRNVMIYFDKPTRETLVERFREKLAPGGVLFVGLSESLTGLRHGYRLVEPGVYVE